MIFDLLHAACVRPARLWLQATVILPAQCMPQIQNEGVTRKMVRAGSKTGSKRMICLFSVAGLREPGLYYSRCFTLSARVLLVP